jgi:hypothetical protein
MGIETLDLTRGFQYKDCSSVNIFAAFENLLTEKRGF